MTNQNSRFTWGDGVSLLDHVKEMLKGLERGYDQRFKAIEDAVIAAREAQEKRWSSSNEVRGSLDDTLKAMQKQQESLVSRLEYNAMVERLQSEIKALQISKATLEGKASQEDVSKARDTAVRARILAIIGTVTGIVFGIVGIAVAFIK